MKEKGAVFVTAFSPLTWVFGYCYRLHLFNRADEPWKVPVMNERMIVNYVMPHVNMYRVIGAIVIILGLYLVMWGKANDNNSFLSVDQCQIAPARELVNASRNGKENPNHEANTISK
jgi:hypothetical protein